MKNLPLPIGVTIQKLTTHQDHRGAFTELFRDQWQEKFQGKQWNLVHSNANTVRGFHVHIKHTDYLICTSGKMILGLKDLRENSPTFNLVSNLELSGDQLEGVFIPPGVGHGFCFVEAATLVYAVSEYWSKDDEIACFWNDPALGLDWPIYNPIVSKSDANAMSYKALMLELKEQQWSLSIGEKEYLASS